MARSPAIEKLILKRLLLTFPEAKALLVSFALKGSSHMLKTAEIPEIVVKHMCPGCMHSLLLNEETFDFCPRCARCLEEIHGHTSGSVCEKCAKSLRPGERSR